MKPFLPILLLCCTLQLQAQRVISGFVKNAANAQPIPAATISIPGLRINTVTDQQGRFELKVDAAKEVDSVLITHISFEPLKVHVNAITRDPIFLSPLTIQLQNVEIKAVAPVDIVRRAITNFSQNYYTKPHVTRGFYRYAARKSNDYIHLSEAVFDVYQEGANYNRARFKLQKARMETDNSPFKGTSYILFGLKPENVYEYDVVKNVDNSDFLTNKGLKQHQFKLNGTRMYNGEEVYDISFDQRDDIKQALYKGHMYIHVDNYAITFCEYSLSPKGLKYWMVKSLSQRALMKMLNVYETILQDTISIAYQNLNGRYFLNKVQERANWRIHSPRVHFDVNALSKIDYLVTSIDTLATATFPSNETMGDNRYIEFKSSATVDDFWKEYNLIPADYDVDSVAASIKAHRESANYKKLLSNRIPKWPKDPAIRIDSVLQFYYQKKQFNGVALVYKNGEVIYSKGLGYADIEKKIPNSLHTQFRIGSLAKPFTAILCMQLVQDGIWQTSDSIGKFLPWFAHGNITISQLLSHQSGIPNLTNDMEKLSKYMGKSYSTKEMVTQFCSDELQFHPGQSFQYSNSNYIVLAAALEAVTGKSLQTLLSEKVFQPLQMTHSFWGPATPSDTLMAKGYEGFQPELRYPIGNLTGAAAITSNAKDLLNWYKGLRDFKILNTDRTGEMYTPRSFYEDWDANYGFGWMIDKTMFYVSKKHEIRYHPGTDGGFYSMFVQEPTKDINIILLSNNGDFPRFDMTSLLLDILN
ncbi:serine hydrolase [Chitinophaga skermanii]|nr:serine hydrolase [Chitinophaga skermanii]